MPSVGQTTMGIRHPSSLPVAWQVEAWGLPSLWASCEGGDTGTIARRNVPAVCAKQTAGITHWRYGVTTGLDQLLWNIAHKYSEGKWLRIAVVSASHQCSEKPCPHRKGGWDILLRIDGTYASHADAVVIAEGLAEAFGIPVE